MMYENDINLCLCDSQESTLLICTYLRPLAYLLSVNIFFCELLVYIFCLVFKKYEYSLSINASFTHSDFKCFVKYIGHGLFQALAHIRTLRAFCHESFKIFMI